LLSAGDSAAFKVNADSIFAKTFMAPLPEFIDKGSALTFTVKVIKIQNKEEYEKEQMKMMEEQQKSRAENSLKQKEIDQDLIQKYIAEKGIKAEKTASGIYYVITTPGKGSNAKSGDKVTVHYKGTLLDGTEFDSSIGKQPLQFNLGKGEVIPGWDEGIALLNKGAKGIIIIPSELGYGEIPMGDKLPANSVLVFEVELVNIN
jgi:FKBP-type peptidyl-prolyl cis-trans isomerase FkpA